MYEYVVIIKAGYKKLYFRFSSPTTAVEWLKEAQKTYSALDSGESDYHFYLEVEIKEENF